jgi:hypothetical protein
MTTYKTSPTSHQNPHTTTLSEQKEKSSFNSFHPIINQDPTQHYEIYQKFYINHNQFEH